MGEATLVFPHQLFSRHPAIAPGRRIYLVEDPLFFHDAQYPALMHKQKLVLHRASMKEFASNHGKASYIDYSQAETDNLFKQLLNDKVHTVFIVDPSDDILTRRLNMASNKHGIGVNWVENPSFLTAPEDYEQFFATKKRYHQTDFYIWQRQRLDLMVNKGKPSGGKWTFDSENRKKLPKTVHPPDPYIFDENAAVEEAKRYVNSHFSGHPGTTDGFNYPTTAAQAKKLLDYFLAEQLDNFGPYQDSISQRYSTLFHSKLSAPLNCGLLTPEEIVNRTLAFASSHKVPMASLEGFIRQIVGWREFFSAIYTLKGVSIRNSNFFNHQKELCGKWYDGELGIPPVDDAIKKLHSTAYSHHIERLMILGNFMLLCEIKPDAVYRWFMEMYIDSYDWVMVPNVYSMSQYADGGLIVTKPYISGSNYILKMSDYPKGEWCQVWDGLYWRFLHKHEAKLKNNPRMTMIYNLLYKMEQKKLQTHIAVADQFLETIEN